VAIKFNSEKQHFEASYSKRHLVTRVPISRRRIGIKTKAQAKRVEAELIVLVEKLVNQNVVPTWSELVNRYITHMYDSDYQVKTVDNYKLSLNAHTVSEWGNRAIDSITPMEIKQLIKEKLINRSESTRKNLRKYINGAFNYAVECGDIPSNPTPRMKFKISA
jgi:hypothetical protein